MGTSKDALDISGQRGSGWNITFGSASLHKGTESTIVNDLERSVAFSNPTNKLHAEDLF